MAARNLTPKLSRREVLGLGAIGAAGVAITLTGCSASETASNTDPNAFKPGLEIGPVSEIPVGAGRNYTVDGVQIVVTQPVADEFHAFSSICTHQGCVVGCRDKIIKCDCHQAIFDSTTGEPTSGPAETALPSYKVEVKNGVLYSA